MAVLDTRMIWPDDDWHREFEAFATGRSDAPATKRFDPRAHDAKVMQGRPGNHRGYAGHTDDAAIFADVRGRLDD